MEYTITVYEQKINQKLSTLLKLQKKYMPVSEYFKDGIELKHLLNAIVNSEDFEKLLDANIALFED